MKFEDAKRLIFDGPNPAGYRVHFEWEGCRMLRSDYFPGDGETLLKDEQDAWDWAKMFANVTRGRCVNIYVVDDHWHPVPGYEARKISNRE